MPGFSCYHAHIMTSRPNAGWSLFRNDGGTSRAVPGWLVWVLIFASGLLVFWSCLSLPFLADDFTFLVTLVDKPWFESWRMPGAIFFRPLPLLSYWLDIRIWGLHPAGFHLCNLMLHLANACLVAVFFREPLQRIGTHRAQVVALVAGLIFLVMPSHSEAVDWISGRPDLLVTFFLLLALLAFTRHLLRPRAATLTMFAAAFALALLSKESALILPLCLAGLAIFYWAAVPEIRGRFASRLAGPLLLALLLAAGYFYARHLILGAWIGGYGADIHLDWSPGLLLSNWAWAGVRSLTPPLPLALKGLLSSRIFPMLFWFLLALLLFLSGRRLPASGRPVFTLFLVLLALFFCAELPSANLFLDPYGTDGERFLYFPSVFMACALATGLGFWVRTRWLRLALVPILLLAGAAGMQVVHGYWHTAGRISRHLVQDALARISQPKLLVLNLPDNYRGAYIWRTGFAEAIAVEKLRFPRVLEQIPDQKSLPGLEEFLAEVKHPAARLKPEELPRLFSGWLSSGRLAVEPWQGLLKQYRRWLNLSEISVLGLHGLITPEDRVSVTQYPRRLEVRLEEPGVFFWFLSPSGQEEYAAHGLTTPLLTVFLPRGLPGDTDVLYFDRGRLRPLPGSKMN